MCASFSSTAIIIGTSSTYLRADRERCNEKNRSSIEPPDHRSNLKPRATRSEKGKEGRGNRPGITSEREKESSRAARLQSRRSKLRSHGGVESGRNRRTTRSNRFRRSRTAGGIRRNPKDARTKRGSGERRDKELLQERCEEKKKRRNVGSFC